MTVRHLTILTGASRGLGKALAELTGIQGMASSADGL